MNLDEQLQQMATSGNMVLVELANRSIALRTALTQGQCSADEYKSMLADLVHEANIDQSIEDLQTRENTYTVLNGLLALASIIG